MLTPTLAQDEAQRAKWAECVAGGNGKSEILSRDRKRWALGEWEGVKKARETLAT